MILEVRGLNLGKDIQTCEAFTLRGDGGTVPIL